MGSAILGWLKERWIWFVSGGLLALLVAVWSKLQRVTGRDTERDRARSEAADIEALLARREAALRREREAREQTLREVSGGERAKQSPTAQDARDLIDRVNDSEDPHP